MIDKETLRKVARLQREELLLFDKGIKREDVTKLDLDVPFALILSGIRRCGKSTLLRQLMKKVEGYYYFNFKRPDILQELLNDILARDITQRYKIRNQKVLRELAIFLLTNIGKPFTYNSLKKNFKLGSINSVI